MLQKTIAGAGRSEDPVDALDRIDDAAGALDVALAGARNQQRRLAHARDAYAGAVVSARSQIAEAKSVIGGAGVEARTRLAKRRRQLGLAEVASDPVEALDTARRAITLARDADALARYDGDLSTTKTATTATITAPTTSATTGIQAGGPAAIALPRADISSRASGSPPNSRSCRRGRRCGRSRRRGR